jgi:hypothetical protein
MRYLKNTDGHTSVFCLLQYDPLQLEMEHFCYMGRLVWITDGNRQGTKINAGVLNVSYINSGMQSTDTKNVPFLNNLSCVT